MGATGIILCILGGAAGGLLLAFFTTRCPSCAKSYVLKRTGATERRGGFWFGSVFQEFRCKHCGHTEWRKRVHTSGG